MKRKLRGGDFQGNRQAVMPILPSFLLAFFFSQLNKIKKKKSCLVEVPWKKGLILNERLSIVARKMIRKREPNPPRTKPGMYGGKKQYVLAFWCRCHACCFSWCFCCCCCFTPSKTNKGVESFRLFSFSHYSLESRHYWYPTWTQKWVTLSKRKRRRGGLMKGNITAKTKLKDKERERREQ